MDLSTGLVNHQFGFALRQHSREELLFSLRWYLGPGISELYHLAQAAIHASSDQIHTYPPILHLAVDADALEAEAIDKPVRSHFPYPFLNANDIDTYPSPPGSLRGLMPIR